MALATRISNAAAIAACNAITALLNTGGAGKVRIYDGTQATDPDTAVGAQVKLAELTLSATAFPTAVDNTGKATATANAITADSSADATGTASWFRAINGAGTAVIDGSVGTSGADMNLNNVSITLGANVSISSWTFTIPET
jgi:hypothetical protein